MNNTSLQGKKVLITAGPTREAIDPVRFISNHSTGKMGYAIAAAFLAEGADVTLVSGPVCLQLQHTNLTIVHIQTASEMYLACCRYFEETDISVFAAAVADYRPGTIALQKIKKQEDVFTIKMVKNVDIAYEFGQVKKNSQVSVGFALETNDELTHAMGKLQNKNFDMVVLNSTNDANAGFGFDTNKITIIKNDFSQQVFPLKSKPAVASDIVKEAVACLVKNENRYLCEMVMEYETMYR
jgi:phosphopantothenoylcysteine decarboxylase / phosphopantothenate---cysteine ligase